MVVREGHERRSGGKKRGISHIVVFEFAKARKRKLLMFGMIQMAMPLLFAYQSLLLSLFRSEIASYRRSLEGI